MSKKRNSHKQSKICMMTSSNKNIFRDTGTVWGESTGHRWIPLTKASDAELCLMLSLIYASANGWANNWDAGDLRRHRANYDVIIMIHECYKYIAFNQEETTFLVANDAEKPVFCRSSHLRRTRGHIRLKYLIARLCHMLQNVAKTTNSYWYITTGHDC